MTAFGRIANVRFEQRPIVDSPVSATSGHKELRREGGVEVRISGLREAYYVQRTVLLDPHDCCNLFSWYRLLLSTLVVPNPYGLKRSVGFVVNVLDA